MSARILAYQLAHATEPDGKVIVTRGWFVLPTLPTYTIGRGYVLAITTSGGTGSRVVTYKLSVLRSATPS